MIRHYRYGSNNEIKESLIIICLVIIAIAILVGSIWTAVVAGGKLSTVIIHNTGFWIVLFIAFVFGIFRKLTNPEKFTWLELPIQLVASLVVIIGLYALFFATSANLTDIEVLNGHVSRAEYYEEWKEEVTYTVEVADGVDSDGNTKYRTETRTRIDYHGPEWKVLTTVGDFSTNENTYSNYVKRFGNKTKKNLMRTNQISIGDGDMFFVSHNGANNNRRVPASIEHRYVNYLKASDSIHKVSGSISGYSELIKPYPRVYGGNFGPIEFNRVVNAGVKLPISWQKIVDEQLDNTLVVLGSVCQVNVIVYCVNTVDQRFAYALEEAWVKGKKNDVVVVIGSTQFPKADFVYIMAWTENEEFKIELRNAILNLNDLADGGVVAKIISDQIKKPDQTGFIRMPMADLEYLIADISLPTWCQILIILIGGTVSLLVSFILIREEVI